jgi:hypothetical protein
MFRQYPRDNYLADKIRYIFHFLYEKFKKLSFLFEILKQVKILPASNLKGVDFAM